MSTTITEEAAGTDGFLSGAYARVELALREQNGIAVTLFWLRGTDVAIVSVDDKRDGMSFELVLEADDRPLEVFHHPYAYAAARGIDIDGPAWEEDPLEEEIVDV